MSANVKNRRALWYLSWQSPYTEPPDGRPRRLAEVWVDNWRQADHKIPEELLTLKSANPGYAIHWAYERKQGTPWSKEAKARNRRRRLRKRIEKKYPLFTELFISEELEKRPRYYAGEDVYE